MASSRRPPSLGELLLQHGLIGEDDLEPALAEHLASGKRLGEILVEQGHLDPERLEEVLEEQMRIRSEAAASDAAADLVEEPGARGIDLLREQLAAAEAELTRHLPPESPEEPETDDTAPSEPPEAAAHEPAAGAVSNGAFVIFVPTAAGYQLIERTGPVPAVGEEVGVSGGTLVVAKIGVSPLPGDLRRCAYLEAPA